MLARLGRFTVRHRKAVLVGTALFFVVAGALSSGVASRFTSGGFDDPSSESSRARRAIEREFGRQTPDLVLLVSARHGTVDDADSVAAGNALTAQLASERTVSRAVSFWNLGGATFGALVWIFQDGNLSGVLDFTAAGTLPASIPLLLFCIAFGLSMDYSHSRRRGCHSSRSSASACRLRCSWTRS